MFYSDSFVPLGSISNYFTLFHNENGYYPVYKNDRFGFNNDDKLYDDEIDAVLIGDSLKFVVFHKLKIFLLT